MFGKGGKGGYGDSWGSDGGDWDSFGPWAAFAGMMASKGGMPWGMMMPWGMSPGGKGGKDGGKGGGKGGGRAPPGGKKVFVGGLPKVPSEDSIREYFSTFGEIEELKLMYNDSGESKGYCFITFDSPAAARQVFDNYDQNMVDGKWVDCKPADGSKESAQKPGDWYCPMCGDLVFARRNSCNMCGFGGGMPGTPSTPMPNGSKPGDWICTNCGDLVFSYRDKCNKCGTAKEGAQQRIGIKKGDWSCPTCGDLVFASKSACSMCGTPKPDDGEGELAYGAAGGKAKSAWSRPY